MVSGTPRLDWRVVGGEEGLNKVLTFLGYPGDVGVVVVVGVDVGFGKGGLADAADAVDDADLLVGFEGLAEALEFAVAADELVGLAPGDVEGEFFGNCIGGRLKDDLGPGAFRQPVRELGQFLGTDAGVPLQDVRHLLNEFEDTFPNLIAEQGQLRIGQGARNMAVQLVMVTSL